MIIYILLAVYLSACLSVALWECNRYVKTGASDPQVLGILFVTSMLMGVPAYFVMYSANALGWLLQKVLYDSGKRH